MFFVLQSLVMGRKHCSGKRNKINLALSQFIPALELQYNVTWSNSILSFKLNLICLKLIDDVNQSKHPSTGCKILNSHNWIHVENENRRIIAEGPETQEILSETKTQEWQDTLFRSFLQSATISETLLGR